MTNKLLPWIIHSPNIFAFSNCVWYAFYSLLNRMRNGFGRLSQSERARSYLQWLFPSNIIFVHHLRYKRSNHLIRIFMIFNSGIVIVGNAWTLLRIILILLLSIAYFLYCILFFRLLHFCMNENVLFIAVLKIFF